MKLFIALFLAVIAIYAYADSHNSFRVQCGSLIGTGYVMVWFGEQTFKIPVECKDNGL